MFVTPKVSAYVQKASLEGKEDKKFVRFTIYVTPILHALACEVSPAIADRLFKFDAAGEPHPVLEMQSTAFEIGEIPLQTMELHPVDDPAMDAHGVLLQAVQISAIHARKVFPEDPNFTLIFNAEVPKNELAVKMMDRYFREKVFLTFATMQQELFPDQDVTDAVTNPECVECGDRAIARDSEKNYLCQKHLRRGIGEVKMIVTLETPAQAEARLLAEREAREAEKVEAGEGPVGDGITDDTEALQKLASDQSHANRPRGGRRNAGTVA